MHEQDTAGRGKLKEASATFKEADTHLFFQSGDSFAEGRLRNIHLLGSPGDTPQLDDSPKIL